MVNSMTGFASSEHTVDGVRLSWELRSVNHRYLDLSIRLPDELKAVEPAVREGIAAAVKRGKLEASLRLQRDASAARPQTVNEQAVTALLSAADRVRAVSPDAQGLTTSEILRWPGVLEEAGVDQAALRDGALLGLNDAISGLVEARRREGSRIEAFLVQRCGEMSELLSKLRPHLGEAESRYRVKLLERLDRVEQKGEPERLEQELVYVAQRMDVSEEMDRLVGHIDEVTGVLKQSEPIGRRLDFLIQELNREANTLASKSADEAMTRTAVELKVRIEQMREQVQNVE